jgi:hypothetical protein
MPFCSGTTAVSLPTSGRICSPAVTDCSVPTRPFGSLPTHRLLAELSPPPCLCSLAFAFGIPLTLRWREQDSNHRYPEKGTSFCGLPAIDPMQFAFRQKPALRDRDRWFESISLQRRVSCGSDFVAETGTVVKRAISAVVSASCAIAAMRLGAKEASGRVSEVIGTPAVDQIRSG